MQIKKLLTLFLALAMTVGLTGCGVVNDNSERKSVPPSGAVISETEGGVISDSGVEETVAETSKAEQPIETVTEATNISPEIIYEINGDFKSVDYDFDFNSEEIRTEIVEYIFSLWREEMSFLNDEQINIFIRAFILMDSLENLRSFPQTGKLNSYFLFEKENGAYLISESPTSEKGEYCEYVYVSTYLSFVEYLSTVFTDESIDEFIDKYNEYNLLVINDELFVKVGDRGGNVWIRDWETNLISEDNNRILITHETFQSNGIDEWTTTTNIDLINTNEGWRIKMFDYLGRDY